MDYKYCELCGTTQNLHHHHVFFGPNRKHSERYGLVAILCGSCHTGPNGVHNNRELDLHFKRKYQTKFERKHSREVWMMIFGRNYL